MAYEGETGSNGYSRGKEHEAALEHKQEENAMWKHCLVAHEGQRVEFSMKVVGNFHSYLLGPSGERGGEDQKIQGRIDEPEGRVPSAPSSQGGAHPRASE